VKHKKFDGDLLLTTACPVECDFCIYACNPDGDWMPEKTIRRVAEEYTKNDIGIRICGGEPFYDFKKLERCLDIVLEHQKPEEVLIITSGFFGKDPARAAEAMDIIAKRKFDTIVLSLDRFHLPVVPMSSTENVIIAAKKRGIKVIVRVTADEESYGLLKDVAGLLVRHDAKLEPHFTFGLYGKAELLDHSLVDNMDKRKEFMKKCFKDLGREYKDFTTNSPKRSEQKFARRFYPTTFPNGNCYADSLCAKGCLMGNIHDKPLKQMIDAFSRTLPGYILRSEKSVCGDRMPCLLSPLADTCDYCRSYPFIEEMPAEAIGRQYVNVDLDNPQAPKTDRELLLSLQLEEKHLNKAAGQKVVEFLSGLDRFVLSKPLPRCMLGTKHSEITEKYKIPKDCFECRELFTVEDLKVRSCKYVSKTGPLISEIEDRKKIWEYFKEFRMKMEPSGTCRKCVYFRRKQCDGLCFRS